MLCSILKGSPGSLTVFAFTVLFQAWYYDRKFLPCPISVCTSCKCKVYNFKLNVTWIFLEDILTIFVRAFSVHKKLMAAWVKTFKNSNWNCSVVNSTWILQHTLYRSYNVSNYKNFFLGSGIILQDEVAV